MGAYAFESKPPFRITKITLEPLLSGSRYDGGMPDKPPCVFCGAAIYRDNRWLVTFGVNDIKCGYAYIPHKELLERMVDL